MALPRTPVQSSANASSRLAITMLTGFSPGAVAQTPAFERRAEPPAERDAGEPEAQPPRENPAALPDSTQIIAEGERQIDANSHAFSRLEGRARLTEQFQASRAAFRSALRTASQSANGSPAARPAAPASPAAPAQAPAPATPAQTPANASASPTSTPQAAAPPASAAPPAASASAAPVPVHGVATQVPVAPTPAAASSASPTSLRVTAVGATVALQAARPVPSGPAAAPAPLATAAARASGREAPAQIRAAARAPAPDAAEREAQIERLVRMIRTRIEKGRTHAILRLDPPQLGKIRLEMDLRQRELVLNVETETPAAQRLLREEIEALRHGLAREGIRLVEFDVRHAEAPDATPQQDQPRQRESGHGSDAGREQPGTQGSDGGEGAAAEDAPAARSESPAAESRVNLVA